MSAATNEEPAIGVIGGSGLYEIEGLEDVTCIAVETPFGSPSDPVICGRIAGRRVCFLPRHGVGHRVLPHEINHRANLWALRSLNVRWLISVTAVGSLREEMAPRDIVVPDQLIDRTGTQAKHTFFGRGIAAHVPFGHPYCGDMRAVLVAATRACTSRMHDRGALVTMNGPAFSTVAEARMHRMIGADLIGMTNAPEARLAREAEISMATLALVTDYDSWRDDEPHVSVDEVVGNMKANSVLAKRILLDAIPRVAREPTSASHHVLRGAVMTARECWPLEVLRDLQPILGQQA